MSLEVTCPSGLKGVFRGLKVKDERIMTDAKLIRSGKMITKLLASCWESTIDPGPYALGAEQAPNWDSIISADRIYSTLQLRIASYGPKYEFQVTCDIEVCKRAFGWAMDLSDLPVRPLSEKGLKHIATSEPMPYQLADGKTSQWRMLTGDDEQFLARLEVKEQSRFLTHSLAKRIVKIEGSEENYKAVLAAIEDFEAADADLLWDEIDEIEGGVETVFEVECPSCEGRQRVTLPLQGSFFSKRKRFAHTTSRTGYS